MRKFTFALLLATAASYPAQAQYAPRERAEGQSGEHGGWQRHQTPGEPDVQRGQARQADADTGGQGRWMARQAQAQAPAAPQSAPQRNWGGNRGWQGQAHNDSMSTATPSVPQNRNWQGRPDSGGQPSSRNWDNRRAAPVVTNDAQRRWNGDRAIDRRDNDRRDNDRRWDGNRNNGQAGLRGDWQRNGDGRWERRGDNDRNWSGRNYTNNWSRDWRQDRRYNWQDYRNQFRDHYRAPRYYDPYGSRYGYRQFGIGIYLDSLFYSNRYWLDDPYDYRLPPAPYGCRWVRYYDDVLLVDIRSGYVVDVIHDFFF